MARFVGIFLKLVGGAASELGGRNDAIGRPVGDGLAHGLGVGAHPFHNLVQCPNIYGVESFLLKKIVENMCNFFVYI